MATHLPHLPEVERLSPICIRILGGNPSKFTLQGTNTYLLGSGASRLLIDTGQGEESWLAAVKRTVEEEKVTIGTALITHWHADHVGGISQLRQLYPDIKVHKHDPDPGQLAIDDGQEFVVEGATLKAVHSPGHTKDHMALVLHEEDAMFTGDNVLGHGTAVFENLGAYLQSLKLMKPLFSGRAYPGHGAVIEDGPAKIEEYLKHRAEREHQVIQTLRSKRSAASRTEGWTAADLVKVIYADVREDLHPAAEKGLLQILEKMKDEGRVARQGATWHLEAQAPL